MPRFLIQQRTKIIFVAVFAIVGSAVLFVTHAANSTASTEPENGALNGVASIIDASASGGKAIKFGNGSSIPTTATAYLPIDLPAQSWLKQGMTSGTYKKLVFAHYFTQFPISEDNKAAASDYYTVNYLAPNGEGGAHAAYGGFLRERPLPRAVDASSAWQLDDMKTEVTRATQAGLDGFTMDMLSINTSTNHWTNMMNLITAAQAVDSNFKIMLMPDASSLKTQTYSALGDAIASIANDSTKKNGLFYVNDNGTKRLVISPFGPEIEGAAYWQSFVTYMQNTKGIPVAFVPCFIGGTTTNGPQFASFSYGESEWGARSPQSSAGAASTGITVHTYKNMDGNQMLWMAPVSYQDERPNQSKYAEAQNGNNFRSTWAAANSSNADWIQIPTWNDYSEGAEIAPSSHHGWSLLDLTSYYLSQFKNAGTTMPIVRDVAYVNYRIQQATASVTNETSPMIVRTDSNAPRDDIEVDTFLTGSATVTLKMGSTTDTYTAPAGASFQVYPITAGAVSVTIARSGTIVATITSPNTKYDITIGSVAIQDEHYHYLSSVSSRNDSSGY